MTLRVHRDEALKKLQTIPHGIFRKAIIFRWIVLEDGTVDDYSLNWLFCWCKNGLNSEAAKSEAIHVWNQILPISFHDFDLVTNHEYARKHRYRS